MSNLPESFVKGVQWLIFVVVVGCVLWRWLKKSDDPPRLLAKWAVSACMIGITSWVAATNFKDGGGWGAAFIIAITCAICGVVLGITWGMNIATLVARPLTSLFDGGTQEITPQPCYSIVEARRKQGKYREAIAEIRNQLAKFPGDFAGMLMLAEIQAENLNDLSGAQSTIERLLAEAERSAADGALALNRLADWHLRFGQDPDSARWALERIVEMFPNTERAYLATQRIAHLATPEVLAGKKEPHRLRLGHYQQNIGLLAEPAAIQPPTVDPASNAATLVRHLGEHPENDEAREQLALIYADHYGRLDLATQQLEELIAQPHAPAKHIARWLNVLADLRIKYASDASGARDALQRIVDLFPEAAVAEMARNRMAHLQLELRANKKNQVVRLGASDSTVRPR